MRQSTDYQSRESGTVLGFVIIALVLIGLLAGGFWFIKNRYDVAAKVDTVSQTVKDEANKATTDQKAADTKDKPTTTSPNGSAGTGANANSTSKPSTPAAPTTSQSQSSSASQPSTQQSAPATQQPATVATTGPSHIASTGPVDGFANAFLLAGLLVVGHLYRQSRRHAA